MYKEADADDRRRDVSASFRSISERFRALDSSEVEDFMHGRLDSSVAEVKQLLLNLLPPSDSNEPPGEIAKEQTSRIRELFEILAVF